MRRSHRKLLTLLVLVLFFMGGPVALFPDASGASHELEHQRVSAELQEDDASEPLTEAEHRLLHALGQVEPGLARSVHTIVDVGVHPGPSRSPALVPPSADLQSSLRPPRILPA
jgi:hypothetical protein